MSGCTIPVGSCFDLCCKSGKKIAVLHYKGIQRVRRGKVSFDQITCVDDAGKERKLLILSSGGGEARVSSAIKCPVNETCAFGHEQMYILKPWHF